MTDDELEALATIHLHPQTQAGGEVDMMPLLRAVEAAERERCASMAENYDLGTIDGHAIARCIRGPNAQAKRRPLGAGK